MTALQRLTHHISIARCVKGVIRTAIGELNDFFNHIVRADLFDIDEVRHAEITGDLFAPRIYINADNLVGSNQFRALNNVKTNPAETKDSNIRARLNSCRPHHRTNASGDTATNVTRFIERGVFADFCNRKFRQHREI